MSAPLARGMLPAASTHPMSDPARFPEEALLDLRPRLARFFSSRGRGWAADELADEAILRLLHKLRQGEAIENLGAYALGVARLVLLEHLRGPANRQAPLEDDFPSPDPETDSAGHDCLEQCLNQLPGGSRTLILRFYGQGRQDAKHKDVRKLLAADLGISIDALFIRASKIRRGLRTCVEVCLVDAGESRTDRKSRSSSHSGEAPA